MNRVIKFRAWDKSKEQMIYSGIEFELRSLSYPSKYGNNNKGGSDSIGFINTNEEYFKIQQFTGLQDKNGVDIYEGDIIDSNYKTPCLDLVEYRKNGFYSVSINAKSVNILASSNKTIVGNIFQNKELLNNE